MNDEYIELENDDEDEIGSDDILDSLKDLFETKRELDDLLETVVYELLDSFNEQEANYLQHISDIEQENKELKEFINKSSK